MIGVSMTIVWAVSPLGAQSILRVMGTGSRELVSKGSVTHLNTDTPSTFTILNFSGHPSSQTDSVAVINSMYAASLMSADSIKSSGHDIWGNIKVPYLVPDTESRSGDAWVSIPDNGSVAFSSLVGLPLAANIDLGLRLKSNFTMESSHIQLQCSPFVPTATGVDDSGSFESGVFSSYEKWNLSGSFHPNCSPAFPNGPENGTFQAFPWSGDNNTNTLPWILALDTFLDPLWLERFCNLLFTQVVDMAENPLNLYSPAAFANETGISTSEARLQLMFSSLHQPLSTICGVSQSWVESRVDCSWTVPSACLVTAQQPSQKPHASSNITHLSFPVVFTSFSTELPRASGLEFSGRITDASMIYLVNTSTSYIFSLEGRQATLDNVTASDISLRLGQIIITYLMLSQAYDSISRGRLVVDRMGTVNSTRNEITTTMWIVETEENYTINTAWLAAFFVTAIAMLVGSIVGAVFCHSSVTPEILGFASAAIRDSRYVNLAPGFGGLGGLEMTNAFEKIEFRYGVVEKSESGQEVLGVSWKVNAGRAKKGVPYM